MKRFIHKMATKAKTKSGTGKRKPAKSETVGDSRFVAKHGKAGRFDTKPFITPDNKRFLTKWERKPAVVLHKHYVCAWAQPDNGRWIAYSPGSEFFYGKVCKNLREAIVTMAGWLEFTPDETMAALQPRTRSLHKEVKRAFNKEN